MSEFKIGQVVNGFTITEVRNKKIFGVKGTLPVNVVDELIEHFNKPKSEQGFFFRSGTDITKSVK